MTDPAQLTAQIRQLIPIFEPMGVEVVEAGRNTVAARIPAAPNVNHFGSVYAGSLFTVAEVLGGLFAQTALVLEGAVPLVKSLTIDFRRPASTAVVARASMSDEEAERVLAETLRDGKAEYLLEAEVTDEAGTVVATTRGTYQLRRL
ncbi:PaaI family thioesterase [Nocardioides sp. SYSU DS0651]|uniref:PaaI family thioesterase n=1 Tax=Nocardioides sp. SYSU DS0651 TaxID=3415955 RepID=UPI003F4B91D1